MKISKSENSSKTLVLPEQPIYLSEGLHFLRWRKIYGESDRFIAKVAFPEGVGDISAVYRLLYLQISRDVALYIHLETDPRALPNNFLAFRKWVAQTLVVPPEGMLSARDDLSPLSCYEIFMTYLCALADNTPVNILTKGDSDHAREYMDLLEDYRAALGKADALEFSKLYPLLKMTRQDIGNFLKHRILHRVAVYLQLSHEQGHPSTPKELERIFGRALRIPPEYILDDIGNPSPRYFWQLFGTYFAQFRAGLAEQGALWRGKAELKEMFAGADL